MSAAVPQILALDDERKAAKQQIKQKKQKTLQARTIAKITVSQ